MCLNNGFIDSQLDFNFFLLVSNTPVDQLTFSFKNKSMISLSVAGYIRNLISNLSFSKIKGFLLHLQTIVKINCNRFRQFFQNNNFVVHFAYKIGITAFSFFEFEN